MESSIEYMNSNMSIEEVIDHKIEQHVREDSEDAFFLCDLGDVTQKYKLWNVTFPRIKPFYAVKCNDDATLLDLLKTLGTGFDCASKAEIQKVMALGVRGDRIIYANPCKQSSHVKYASKVGVEMMTFDNENELYKIKALYPEAKVVLRILPPATDKVQCILGNKYGCLPSNAEKLVQTCHTLGLNLHGVSFHVGSGCYDAVAYRRAVEESRTVFDIAQKYGYDMKLLDVGGGFPGTDSAKITVHEIAVELNAALDELFPKSSGIDIISEPGRFFSASAYTLTMNVFSKKTLTADDGASQDTTMYYVNDGVYGSFNCVLYDHQEVSPNIPGVCMRGQPIKNTCIWGPTCDGLDIINTDIPLPELNVGDWIYYKDMGAYTLAAGSTFNGIPRPRVYYIALVHYTPTCDQKIAAADQFKLRMKSGHGVHDTIKPLPLSRETVMFGI